MISTSNLELLPDILALRNLTNSIAMLEAILCPEWEYHYGTNVPRLGRGEL